MAGRTIITAIAAVATACAGLLYASDGDRDRGFQAATGVVVPIYLEGDTLPSAKLMIHDVHRSFLKRGFFRIGTIPIVDVRGLCVEIHNRSQTQRALSDTERWVKKLGAGTVEITEFALVFGGENSLPSLEAGRAEMGTDGVWRLSGGVVSHLDGVARRANSGTLQITGADAGDLIITTPDGQRLRKNIFETVSGVAIRAKGSTKDK